MCVIVPTMKTRPHLIGESGPELLSIPSATAVIDLPRPEIVRPVPWGALAPFGLPRMEGNNGDGGDGGGGNGDGGNGDGGGSGSGGGSGTGDGGGAGGGNNNAGGSGSGTGNGNGSGSTGSGEGGEGDGDGGDESDLPEWAQKALKGARSEAAKYRNERNDARTAQQTQADQIKNINKALGLDTDDPDPDALTKANAEKDNEIRMLKTERAFGKAAKNAGADEELTLAVLSSQGKLSKLDPDADDFSQSLEALVKEAVEANPKLKVTQAVSKSSSKGFSGDGGGRSTGPVDLRGAIASKLSS